MNNGVAQLQVTPKPDNFSSAQTFEHTQRVAKALSQSTFIPKEYQGNIPNTIVALEMAARVGASPLAVMQNLHVVQGKPGWTSTFVIALINSSPKFEGLEFDVKGKGMEMECTAWAFKKGTKDRVEGPTVTMQMAKAEGWLDRNGSKWKTMPDLMIRYRSATFFGRLYTPELMIGMQTTEEIVDISHTEAPVVDKEEQRKLKEAERLTFLIDDAKNLDELEMVEQYLTPEFQAAFDAKKSKLIDA